MKLWVLLAYNGEFYGDPCGVYSSADKAKEAKENYIGHFWPDVEIFEAELDQPPINR